MLLKVWLLGRQACVTSEFLKYAHQVALAINIYS